MRGKLFLFLIILLSSTVSAGFIENAQYLEDKIHDFAQDEDTVIFFGEKISNAERIMYNYLKDNDDRVKKFKVVSEIGNETVFLVGGPRQNKYTEELLNKEGNNIEEENLEFGTLIFITTNENQKFMIFSDRLGFENVARNPGNSPLAKFIPLGLVPVVATGIGFSLLWLWKFLLMLLKKILRLGVSSKLMSSVKKKELNKKYKGVKIKGVRVKYREWISIVMSAAVFALAVSFSYIFGGDGFIIFILANVIVNTVIYSIRHFTRLFMDRVHEIHTEYVFWVWGGLITVLSGWLGNTFALAGYTVSDPERKSQKEGKIQFMIDLFSFLAAIIFLVWNYITPNTLLQMSMILALAIAVIQMLPFDPFGGRKVYRWSKKAWWLLFIPMFIVYSLVNFLI